jgi:hypothetical protein
MRIPSSPYAQYIAPAAPRTVTPNPDAKAPTAPAKPGVAAALSDILTDEERSFFAADAPSAVWYGQNGATRSAAPAVPGGLVDVRG